MNTKKGLLQRVPLALLIAGLLGFPALAQDGGTADAPGASETTAPEATAPALGESELVEVPLDPEMRDQAWVRVLNLSPNAGAVDFNLVNKDDNAEQPNIPDFMRGVEYGGHGTYAPVAPGTYTLNLPGAPQEEHDIRVAADRYYTVVVTGLELPPEAQAEGEDEGGFMGWLRGLFGADDSRDVHGLNVMLLEDNLHQGNLDGHILVRVVNAAPGTEEVSLARTGDSDALTGTANYGNATGYNNLDPNEYNGQLELRLGGSQAVTVPLDTLNLAPGSVNTVFLTGTPVEDAPLRAIVLSTPAITGTQTAP